MDLAIFAGCVLLATLVQCMMRWTPSWHVTKLSLQSLAFLSGQVGGRDAARAMVFAESRWEQSERAVMSLPHNVARGWSGLLVGNLREWFTQNNLKVEGGEGWC